MKLELSRRLAAIMLVVMALTTMVSCAKFQHREQAMQLRVGMTKNEVLNIMGEPIRGKQYCTPNIWFYYIETRWAWDFQSTRDECLPIVFQDGKIIGWGQEYYKRNVLFPLNQ
ncbi:MAG: DUF3192 domain-containing protein [Victivallales bacterium]|nr:DUF3192 domain-containing protein [Victivallales bacterium]